MAIWAVDFGYLGRFIDKVLDKADKVLDKPDKIVIPLLSLALLCPR